MLHKMDRDVVGDLGDASRMLEDRLELCLAHEEAALLVTPTGEQFLKLGIELSVRHGPVGQSDLVVNRLGRTIAE